MTYIVKNEKGKKATYTLPGNYLIAQPAQAAEPQKRYISVWVIDQDENVPLDRSILYEKAMFFTDKTPDEIRADIPLANLLKKHNEYRITLKGKDDKILKPVRLRDIQIVIKNW